MRLLLYDAIIARLSRIVLLDGAPHYPVGNEPTETLQEASPAILTFDLWNTNVETLTKQRPFNTPAVFIEFMPIVWQQLGNKTKRADVNFRLHIVTATFAPTASAYRSEAFYRFRLIQAVERALVGFGAAPDYRGLSYGGCTHAESFTDHNHERIIEDIEGWRLHCVDASAQVDSGLILTPHDVTLDDGDVYTAPFDEHYV